MTTHYMNTQVLSVNTILVKSPQRLLVDGSPTLSIRRSGRNRALRHLVDIARVRNDTIIPTARVYNREEPSSWS
jgi:hypothetical protein